MPAGRFAPSPTGRLHIGNLRTALVAWLFARVDGSTFLLRFEDLDTAAVRDEHYDSQVADLGALGLDWDPPAVRQSDRTDRYEAAMARLLADDAVYPCFCTRREIREAAQAPHDPLAGHRYPGTCHDLSAAQRRARARDRPPALRIRAEGAELRFNDRVAGPRRYEVDDFVVRRNDGTPAYHLAVVVDDAAQGIELVVRADDLLESTARHLLLYQRLGAAPPDHAHVPLVLAPSGERLAKRHGAVTLDDRAARGEGPERVRSYLAATLGLCRDGDRATPADLLAAFDPSRLPTEPLVLPASYLTGADAEVVPDADQSSSSEAV